MFAYLDDIYILRTPGVPGQDPTPLRSAVRVVTVASIAHQPGPHISLGSSSECSFSFAHLHDEGLWRCLCRLLDIPRDLVPQLIGLQRHQEPRSSFLGTSWADAVHLIHERHPDVAHPWRCPKLGGCRQSCRQSEGCRRIRTSLLGMT